MLQPGTRNVVENVKQYVEQPQQDLLQPYTWGFICAERKKDNFFKVQYFRSIASKLCKGKEEIDMPYLIQCNNCKKPIGDSSFYFCFHCKDYYQLCASCNENVKHEHKMEKFGFDVNPLTETRIKLFWVPSFLHAIECFDQKCAHLFCDDIKRAFVHNRAQHKDNNWFSCSVCTQLIAILMYHAKSCTDIKCRVPHCRTNFVRWSYKPAQQFTPQLTVGVNEMMAMARSIQTMQQGGTLGPYGTYTGGRGMYYGGVLGFPMNYWYGNN